MRGYEVVSDFVHKYGGSEEELLRWYYCDVLNSAAIAERRNGGKGELGDKYILTPKVCAMEKCLNGGGVKGFFDNEEVRSEGLSLEGFVGFVENLSEATEEYSKNRGLLEIGWEN